MRRNGARGQGKVAAGQPRAGDRGDFRLPAKFRYSGGARSGTVGGHGLAARHRPQLGGPFSCECRSPDGTGGPTGVAQAPALDGRPLDASGEWFFLAGGESGGGAGEKARLAHLGGGVLRPAARARIPGGMRPGRPAVDGDPAGEGSLRAARRAHVDPGHAGGGGRGIAPRACGGLPLLRRGLEPRGCPLGKLPVRRQVRAGADH